MADTPYSTPQSDLSGPQAGADISQQVVDKLAGTRPWALFLAILAFVGAGFTILGGLILMIAGSAVGFGESAAAGVGFGVIGFFYIVMAAVYLIPAIFLARFASRIKDVIDQPNNDTLVEALEQQRKFWKFIGVLTIVGVALGMLLAIVMPIFVVATGAFANF